MTVANVTTEDKTTTTFKTPIAHYGWLYDMHGVYLLVANRLSFRDDATQQWQDVDLPTLTQWGMVNGRVDIADLQLARDRDRVHKCSKTLQAVA